MQIIHYVPCSCQLLDSCECGLTRPTSTCTTGSDNSPGPGLVPVPGPCPRPISNGSSSPNSKWACTNENNNNKPPVSPPVVIIPNNNNSPPPPPPPPTPPISSISSLSSVPEELTTVDRIYCEARRAGVNVSFYLANYQFRAFTATLTSQWRLNLVAAVIITNIQNGIRSLLLILVAWPSNVFLGNNFTQLLSAISYIMGVVMIYGKYPSFVSYLFLPGLFLVTLGQSMNEIAYMNKNKHEVDDEDDKEKGRISGHSFQRFAGLALKNLWLFLKRYWVEVIAFFVAVFFFPGQQQGLWIIIWMLLATTGFNLAGQLYTFLTNNDRIAETSGNQHQHGGAMYTSSSVRAKWAKFHYIWRDTIDKKEFLKTLRISLVFLPYIIISEVADTNFVQQIQEIKPVHIFGKPMSPQAFSLLSMLLEESIQKLSHWLYTKTDDGDAPRTRFYGTLRVGLAIVLAIPCYVLASVVETKRWEDDYDDFSVLSLIPQLILIAIVKGLANDGIECFFELELPDSIGKSYGFLFVNGLVALGKFLSAMWNAFWGNVTRTGGNPGWLDEKDGNKHRFDRYYSVMAIFADVSCIIYVFVAYRYSVKYHKRSTQ